MMKEGSYHNKEFFPVYLSKNVTLFPEKKDEVDRLPTKI